MGMNALGSGRENALHAWLSHIIAEPIDHLDKLAGDASFRCYYRFHTNNKHYVVMDAPPSHEDCKPFIAIDEALRSHDVTAPEIIAQDVSQGFLLLSDFGDTLYESVLNAQTADHYYRIAFQNLLKIQHIKTMPNESLPVYSDDKLRAEMQLFIDWYYEGLCEKKADADTKKIVNNVFDCLIQSANEQPRVFVHRDYHCRNLMLLPDDKLGVLDFQDAVWGPVTYDLVSLLRDCYIDWPQEKVRAWALTYRELAIEHKIMPANITADGFCRWFDWMGLQRHLKCLGIFSRLHLRDNKPLYLQSIPRVLNYARSVAEKYNELSPLLGLLK